MKKYIWLLALVTFLSCSSEKKPPPWVTFPPTPNWSQKLAGSWTSMTAVCDGVYNPATNNLEITTEAISYTVDLGSGCAPEVVMNYSVAPAADAQGYLVNITNKTMTCDEIACGGPCPLPLPDRIRWSFTDSNENEAMTSAQYDDPASPVQECFSILSK